MASGNESETALTNMTLVERRREMFPTTRWTLVAAAGARGDAEGRRALAQLCEAYWYPVYGYMRGRGHSPDNAQDLTQGFFLQVLSGTFFERADSRKGAFRAFLVHAMKYFLADEFDRETAKKRGGGVAELPFTVIDGEAAYAAEPSHEETPERIFQRRWAETLLHQAMGRVREDFARSGRLDHFQELQPFLANQEMPPYAVLADKLRISESALKAAIHRIRKRYREALRAEVEATVGDANEVDGELRFLIGALSGGGE